jgi:hypothetical protein
LLLCGPVLRRVEPRAVSVWVALSTQASVTVDLFTDIVDVGTGSSTAVPPRASFARQSTPTIRIGDHLHVALVTVALDGSAGVLPLMPGTLYSYNVTFASAGGTADLRSLGLLQDKGVLNGGSDNNAPIAEEPLGYENGRLPGFATVPARLEDLHIAHASCSKMHGDGDPLLAQVDDLVKDNRTNALPTGTDPARPHQLFLTGDQIYADDVATALLATLNELGHTLLGTGAAETLAVNTGGTEGRFDATTRNFPSGRRHYLASSVAKFTSDDAASHLLSFGEFAAMYLLAWSPAAWPHVAATDGVKPVLGTLARWTEPAAGAADHDAWVQNEALFAQALPAHDDAFVRQTVLDPTAPSDPALEPVLTPFFTQAPPAGSTPDGWTKLQTAAVNGLRTARIGFFDDRKKVSDVYATIWKVRRALANIPTYTICDDHEVTDDWNLTQHWQSSVLGSSLGKNIVRNALAAYTLFQAWGNDPAAFHDPAGAGGSALSAAQALFPSGEGTWPDAAATATLDTCFGLTGALPTIRFDYVIDGNAHRAIVMDSRTRRSYEGLDTPPALLSDDALRDQIQRGPLPTPLPAGIELLLVISPAPMVGPPLFEETLLPLGIRAFDAYYMAIASRSAVAVEKALTGIDRSKPTGAQFLDAEGWSNNPRALEKMLAGLAAYGAPVVILAGDVHYASSFSIDYQTAGQSAVRFVHLTSSAAQNAWPARVCSFMASVSWGRSLTGAALPARRFGWTDATPSPLDDTSGERPPLIGKVKRHPVLLPAGGWRRHHAFTRPPDWRWDLGELVDTRNDADRPLKARPEALPPGDVTSAMNPNPGTFGYGALAKAHVDSMDLMFLRRGTVFSNNYGHVSFARPGGALAVTHELHSVRPHPDPGEDDEGYTVHASSLTPAISPAPSGIG